MQLRNYLKLAINLLALVFIACSIPSPYSREDIPEKVKTICKKEYDIDVNAWLSGDTIWLQVPKRTGFWANTDLTYKYQLHKDKIGEYQTYLINDLDFDRRNNFLAVNFDVEIQAKPEFPFAEQELGRRMKKVYRNVTEALHRILLNTDNPPKFYCLVISNAEDNFDNYFVVFVPDMIKLQMNRISLGDYSDRELSFSFQHPESVDGSSGKHLQPYDISPNEFVSLLTIQNLGRAFDKTDKEGLPLPLGEAKTTTIKTLNTYNLIHSLKRATLKDTRNKETLKLKFKSQDKALDDSALQNDKEFLSLTKMYKVSFYLRLANFFYREKDYPKAKQFPPRALSLIPDYPYALNYLGIIENASRNYSQAMVYFNQVIKKHPKNAEAYDGLARAYSGLGHYTKALINFKKVKELKPNSWSVNYDIGFTQSLLGNKAEAIVSFEEALKALAKKAKQAERDGSINFHTLKMHKAMITLAMGTIYAADKEYNRALDYYQKALKINPDYPGIYNQIGRTNQTLGDVNAALRNYEKEIKQNPDFIEAYLNLAFTYRTLKEYDKAISYCEKAIEIDPRIPEIYLELGNVYDAAHQRFKAIEQFKKAIELNPNNILAFDYLGWAHINLEQFDQALTAFKKAIEIDPTYAAAYNGLGSAYYHLKKYSQARENFTKAKKLFLEKGDFKTAERIDAVLEQLP